MDSDSLGSYLIVNCFARPFKCILLIIKCVIPVGNFCFLFKPRSSTKKPHSGTDLKLSYLSSRAALGISQYLRSVLCYPFNLMKVHLMVAVVGRLFQKWFPASPNLAYTFIWDKTDAYNQKVYGLSEAVGKSTCKCIIFCTKNTVLNSELT